MEEVPIAPDVSSVQEGLCENTFTNLSRFAAHSGFGIGYQHTSHKPLPMSKFVCCIMYYSHFKRANFF